MHVPKDVLSKFKRLAIEVFPDEEPQDAVSLLLSLFIESIADEDKYWTLFVPGLSLKAKQAWEQMARVIADAAANKPYEDLPPELQQVYGAVKERRLTAADAVAVIVSAAQYGRLEFDGKTIL